MSIKQNTIIGIDVHVMAICELSDKERGTASRYESSRELRNYES